MNSKTIQHKIITPVVIIKLRSLIHILFYYIFDDEHNVKIIINFDLQQFIFESDCIRIHKSLDIRMSEDKYK